VRILQRRELTPLATDASSFFAFNHHPLYTLCWRVISLHTKLTCAACLRQPPCLAKLGASRGCST
jgi:hypothetical protein